MRHKVAGRKLGRNPSHRRALLRNMVTSFLEHERLVTTLPKAKEIRPLADKMITLGKRDTLHARRQVKAYLLSDEVTRKVFSTLAPRFGDRPGGYSRIVRLDYRVGDGAERAVIELLGSGLQEREDKKDKKDKEDKEDKEDKANKKAESAETKGGKAASED